MAAFNKKDSVDVFLGTDSSGNPINDAYMFKGDSRYTEKSEDIARRYNWNMMLYQNDYNDPSSQLQRLKDAGLNPLYYLGENAGTTPAGAGGSMSGNSMTSASGDVGQAIQATGNLSDSLLDAQRLAQQYDISRRQLDLQDRQVGIAEKQLGINQKKADQDISESKSREDVNKKTLDEIESRIKLNDEQRNELQSKIAVQQKSIDEIQATIDQLKSIKDLNYAQIKRMFKLLPAEYDKLQAETNLTYHQANTEVEKMFNFMMNTDLSQVEIEVSKGRKVLLERQADGQIYTNLMLQNNADWNDAKNEMQVVTGYWQAFNGSLNAVANTVNATGSAFGNVTRGMNNLMNVNTHLNPSVTPAAPGTPWWIQP